MARILGFVFVVALVPMLLGVLVGWGGYLGFRGKLPRDRGAGVRTSATLRSDEAFRLANRVAGLPTLVAGAIGVAAGAAGLAMPNSAGTIIAAAIGLAGMFLLVAGGGVLGHRAAAAVPPPSEPSAGCAGCACGGCSALTGAAGASSAADRQDA